MLICLLFLLFMMVSACAATVTNIRVGESSDGVRVVVDMTSEVAYKLKKLANPPRLVIDLESSGMADFNPVSVFQTRKSITGVRLSRVDGDRLRIVVEFNRVYNVSRDFVLEPVSGLSWRLVVDLTPEGMIEPPEPPPDSVAETGGDNTDLETLITTYQNENIGGS